MAILERTTLIPDRTCEEVFEFCLDGANFPKIFPERITPCGPIDPDDVRITLGREFRFRHWMFNCIPSNWAVRIQEVQPNEVFIDEMLQGPLRSFRHEHRVRSAPGGTFYTDRVTYRAIGGRWVERLIVDRYMARIFAARHQNMLVLLKAQ